MNQHLLSDTAMADWRAVNRFFIEQTAYIARKTSTIQQGPRTLLDNTMLIHRTSLMAGAKHDNDQLPVILLGGRVLYYKDEPERQPCRLFMSVMYKIDQRTVPYHLFEFSV
jgi:hypothetical protein